jgi:hypothetical protein
MPSMPLPTLDDTVRRVSMSVRVYGVRAQYLQSVRPLVDDVEYARVKTMCEEFVAGDGRRLQLILWLISCVKRNWVRSHGGVLSSQIPFTR